MRRRVIMMMIIATLLTGCGPKADKEEMLIRQSEMEAYLENRYPYDFEVELPYLTDIYMGTAQGIEALASCKVEGEKIEFTIKQGASKTDEEGVYSFSYTERFLNTLWAIEFKPYVSKMVYEACPATEYVEVYLGAEILDMTSGESLADKTFSDLLEMDKKDEVIIRTSVDFVIFTDPDIDEEEVAQMYMDVMKALDEGFNNLDRNLLTLYQLNEEAKDHDAVVETVMHGGINQGEELNEAGIWIANIYPYNEGFIDDNMTIETVLNEYTRWYSGK